ncbi:hypothetical protein INP77_10385 [Methylophilus sp. 13]|uniref:hypothetical protein n=1 Tax=Methylophilus sp. 13 TaxID=2781018 RepID=UPI00188E79F3|nr:hypothetical protein [Methylophilus sp. 13]MBF5039897.1 hypothetical protein [Methylophilus sp. 13]
MTESKDPREQLNSLAKALIDDLFKTDDAELLKEASSDKSLIQAATNARDSYQKAIKSLGEKRLEIARAEMKHTNILKELVVPRIDIQRARQIISRLSAANDTRLTLAARNLNHISDTEAIELVNELLELGAIKNDEI